MKIALRYIMLAIVAVAFFMAAMATSGQQDKNPNPGASMDAIFDKLLKYAPLLQEAPSEVMVQFRGDIDSAIKIKIDEAGSDKKFKRNLQYYQFAVELVKSIQLTGVREQMDMEEASTFGWGAGMIVLSLPREVVTEGLAQAIYEFETGEIFAISDQLNDFIRYAYNQEGPDEPVTAVDISGMLQLMRKATAEQRVKLITHLIVYAPIDTLRPLLAQEHKTLEQVAELSGLDRRINEFLWANENGVKLEPAFKEDIVNDLELAVEHDTWWVRLYAVEVMLEHAQLRKPDYIKQLEKDPDPVVSKRAKYLAGELD